MRNYRRPYGGVDPVAEVAFQEVTAEMAIGFEMADDDFDGGPAPEFAVDLSVNAALPAHL